VAKKSPPAKRLDWLFRPELIPAYLRTRRLPPQPYVSVVDRGPWLSDSEIAASGQWIEAIEAIDHGDEIPALQGRDKRLPLVELLRSRTKMTGWAAAILGDLLDRYRLVSEKEGDRRSAVAVEELLARKTELGECRDARSSCGSW
jgi:hypothetical protein